MQVGLNFFPSRSRCDGYCANSVHSCFRKLGFPPKTVRALLKVLGEKAMKSSFCIWAARDDASWKPDVVTWSTSLGEHSTQPTKHPGPLPVSMHPSSGKGSLNSLEQPSKPAAKSTTKLPNKLLIGLLNLGNTCYANSLL